MVKQLKYKDLSRLAIFFLAILGLNILSQQAYFRIDLTAEKRFSLSDSTKTLLRSLEEPVLITVYLEGDFPAGFKRLRNATEELMYEFSAYSKSNVAFRFTDPFKDRTPEEQREMYDYLVKAGLSPTDLNVKTESGMRYQSIFPGAIMAYKGYSLPISLLEEQNMQDPVTVLNKSIELLEYKFATALYQLEHIENRPKVAIAFGHGQLPQALMADFLYQLKAFYQVEGVVLGNDLSALNQSYKCLIVARPDSLFRDPEKFVIDQYIMRGGRVLWLVDQVFTSLDSLRASRRSFTVAINKELGLDPMFFSYGFKVNYDLVQDAQCAFIPIQTGMSGNQPREEMMPWFFFPVLTPDGSHFINRNTGPIKLEFASSIDTVYSPDIKKEVILTSSNMARVLFTPVRVALGMATEVPDERRFNKQHVPLALRLEGKFTSAFTGRLAPTGNFPFLTEGEKSTKMIVVGDGDIVKNKFSASRREHLPLGLDPISGAFYPGNMNFLLNCVNDLTDDQWIIPLRSKQFQLRVLDRVKVKRQGGNWRIANTAIPILLLLLFGSVWNFVQKKKYTR